MIPFYIQSLNGHDTEQVPEDKAAERIKEELNKGKWVTLEKKDGSTDMLTSPEEVKKEKQEQGWTTAFKPKDSAPIRVEDLKTVTSTTKMKGG